MSKVKWVRLGDYIAPIERRNYTKQFGIESVRGISNTKEIMPTKAKVDEDVISKFYVIYPNEFIYNPRTTRMGDKVGLAYNYTNKPLLFSFNNLAFGIKEDKSNAILPEYLYLYLSRDEFDRYARVNSWGSATELFTFEDLSLMRIPLPSLSEQQKVVNVWKAFREIKEQNEAKAAPLMQLCQSYIQELKHKYPAQEIGPYIEESNERNTAGDYGEESVRGLATSKGMIDTKANLTDVSLTSYKLVCPDEIAFVPDTSRRGDKMSLGLNETAESFLVSSISCVFGVKDKEKLLPAFLYLWFCRPEFDRYARFNSWGSAREAFSFDDMKRTKVPIPPLNVQRAIVNIYECANEAKQIAAEADKLSREVCPALLQHVINS